MFRDSEIWSADAEVQRNVSKKEWYVQRLRQHLEIFDFDLYKSAMQKADEQGLDFTDDCQLVELCGGKVKMVEGSYSNIKITTPDDIALAENLLKNEGLL